MEKLDNKNPGSNSGWRPLHAAVQQGHLEICQMIMNKPKDKTPIYKFRFLIQ